MVIPTQQQAYSQAQGTSPIPQFIFRERDPENTEINYPLYTRWVNLITKGVWYLEAFYPSAGVILAQWRALGPVVVGVVDPTVDDYLYPLGQTWVNTAASKFWALVKVVGTVATWEELSSGAATGILTLTGDVGGAVSGDGSRNIDILGGPGVTVTGTPASHDLTINLSGGKTAVDEIIVDANTAPGTNPVVPDATGDITVTGGQIAAGSTVNVIQTDSLAANAYTIEVQRSKSEPAAVVGSNGVCHFNDNDFLVDNNAFVSLQSLTPYTVICAGTGTGAALQDVSGVGTAGQVLTSTGAAALPTWQSGHTESGVLQQVRIAYPTPGSASSVMIPPDNTIPQQTEGVEIFTLSITPKSASSILVISASVYVVGSVLGLGSITSLFRDATADALSIGWQPNLSSSYFYYPTPIDHFVASGSTATTTFKIRSGSSGTGPIVWNQPPAPASPTYGGVVSTMTITEYAQ